jgi:enoyl-CoA hydratase
MLTGARLDAPAALAGGLVNEVAADARARGLELAHELAALPALAVSLTKQAIDLMPETSREAGILIERLAYGMLAQSDDARRLADEWSKG